MKRTFCVILLTACFFSSGCFPSFFNGYVTNKKFTPAHTFTSTTYYMVGKVMIPSTVIIDVKNKWYVTISMSKNGKRTTTIEVLEKTYNSILIGDKVSLENDYLEENQ